MLDRYTLFSLLSIGLAKILFKEKIDRRRIVKQLQAIDVNKQEQVESALELVSVLKHLFLKKKELKYIDKDDTDKILKNYLLKRNIDLEEIEEAFKSFSVKIGSKKIDVVLQELKKIDNITYLKQDKLKQDLKNINALTENVLKTIDELKNDITRNVEKTLVMNQGVINEIEKDKIREQAVRDFLNKMKKQNPTLKKGISIGKIQRK
tara:strand:- start:457 stop:1077 length:621 start_codon:yes stop_codon:yes gene_type:complete